MAGLKVKSGKLIVPSTKEEIYYRVVRKGVVVKDDLVCKTLKRFKDTVNEVRVYSF